MQLKEFELTYSPKGNIFEGIYSFTERGAMCEEVKKAFGRGNQNLCLKIFRDQLIGEVESYYWGSPFCEWDDHVSTLVQASQAQNIASWYGFAPRVYALVIINFKGRQYLAQLTDYMDGKVMEEVEDKRDLYEKIKKSLALHDFLPPLQDVNSENVLSGKWVDWQGAKPKDCYAENLVKRVEKNAYFIEGTHYQTQPEIGLKGFRDSEQRVKDLKLEDLDLQDKTVLDVGCCGGYFCNYVASRGAKRVVGIDIPRNAGISRELSNWLGNWNIDYIPHEIGKDEDIKNLAGIEKFDLVLYLAVNWYLGFPDWLFNISDTIIVEKNGKEDEITDASVKKILVSKCSTVEQIGNRSDFDKQPIFKAKV